jgi:hypothetical protein
MAPLELEKAVLPVTTKEPERDILYASAFVKAFID